MTIGLLIQFPYFNGIELFAENDNLDAFISLLSVIGSLKSILSILYFSSEYKIFFKLQKLYVQTDCQYSFCILRCRVHGSARKLSSGPP